MVNIGNFDASKVTPRETFDPLPPGWYAAQAIESEVREAKSGSSYLQITFELLENYHPDHKGRRVWARPNLWNPNEKTVEIAQRELSGLCRSVGLMTVADSEALHFKPLAIKLKIRPAGNGYDATNEISGYDALGARFGVGAAPAAPTVPPGGAPAAAHAPAAKAPAAPPWKR